MKSKNTPHQSAVVVTVFNEQETVEELIRSLQNQTTPPREVVIVDGGSTDNTWKILQAKAKTWRPLRVFRQPGNRSIGRNWGVAQTTSPIIAFTDAGCIPEPTWLEELTQGFSDPNIHVISGYYKGLYKNIFQKCLIPYVLVMPDKALSSEFFPSTRSMAIRRKLWNQSGGFEVSLSHNEDYAYSHWLKKMGAVFYFAPKAIVGWMPRKNLKQAAWMFMRFAIGDIQAGLIRPKVKALALRYILFIYFVFLSLELRFLMPLLCTLIIAYLTWAVVKNFRYVKDIRALFWLPVLQITADLSVLSGTLIGMMSRVTLKSPS